MNLVFLTYPGVFLDWQGQGTGNRDSFAVQNLLHAIEAELASCAVALDDFDKASREPQAVDLQSARKQWEEERDLRTRIFDEIAKERGLDTFSAHQDKDVALAASRSFHELQLAKGIEPAAYRDRRPLVYARAFVLSTDLIVKLVSSLSKVAGIPPGVDQVLTSLDQAFPGLRHLRNSSAHLEDRVQAVDKKGKTINSKPYAGPGIVTGGGQGGMILEALEGTRFTSTLADGGHGSLDISADTLSVLVAHAQRVVDLLPWRGSPQIFPR
jgi:hypothetical protein